MSPNGPLPSFRSPRESVGFRVSGAVFSGSHMLYIAYLDEFGHVGPYISRSDPTHNASPVFGLGGMILPYDKARQFATWFYQRKCELLEWEIKQSGKHPATWEKKGSALFTTKNIKKYSEIQRTTNRLLNKIKNIGGDVFYAGIEKTKPAENSNATALYLAMLRKAMVALDQYADKRNAMMMIIMDEHQDRDAILTRSSQAMYGSKSPRRNIVEPPFQVESHRYQTCQCADWICGLIAGLRAYPNCTIGHARER